MSPQTSPESAPKLAPLPPLAPKLGPMPPQVAFPTSVSVDPTVDPLATPPAPPTYLQPHFQGPQMAPPAPPQAARPHGATRAPSATPSASPNNVCGRASAPSRRLHRWRVPDLPKMRLRYHLYTPTQLYPIGPPHQVLSPRHQPECDIYSPKSAGPIVQGKNPGEAPKGSRKRSLDTGYRVKQEPPASPQTGP